ncbi:hypothetical protein J5H37_13410 [Stenotrophomonas maltophilia]|nr:hypothetical protein [Stenotrophomonas maltophilia]MBO2881327.1 hypothetical protein [Stenotrophomonas maltophilia]MBO2918693.1 hypothetical protein [Stenotrophomonas maltophilia]
MLFLRAFKRWRGLKPEVYPTCLDGQPAVIKDYRRYRRTSLAQVARLLVRREARILRQLRQRFSDLPPTTRSMALLHKPGWARLIRDGWKWLYRQTLLRAERAAQSPRSTP